MNAITNSPFRKYQHPALLGLSEKALTALFNAGGVRMLQAQEWLFRSGEAATTGFLIFEGNVSCYRQQEPAQVAMQLLADLFWTGLLVCLPVLGLTMLVGLLISIVQAVTQVQEMSLSFVPKLMTAALALVVFGPWMLRTLVQFTIRLWSGIPALF